VLRHEDVASDVKAVALARVFEDFLEGLFGQRIGKIGEALVTTEGDEVKSPSVGSA